MFFLRCGAVLYPYYDLDHKDVCDFSLVCLGVAPNLECHNSCSSCSYMKSVLHSISFYDSDSDVNEVNDFGVE